MVPLDGGHGVGSEGRRRRRRRGARRVAVAAWPGTKGTRGPPDSGGQKRRSMMMLSKPKGRVVGPKYRTGPTNPTTMPSKRGPTNWCRVQISPFSFFFCRKLVFTPHHAGKVTLVFFSWNSNFIHGRITIQWLPRHHLPPEASPSFVQKKKRSIPVVATIAPIPSRGSPEICRGGER